MVASLRETLGWTSRRPSRRRGRRVRGRVRVVSWEHEKVGRRRRRARVPRAGPGGAFSSRFGARTLFAFEWTGSWHTRVLPPCETRAGEKRSPSTSAATPPTTKISSQLGPETSAPRGRGARRSSRARGRSSGTRSSAFRSTRTVAEVGRRGAPPTSLRARARSGDDSGYDDSGYDEAEGEEAEGGRRRRRVARRRRDLARRSARASRRGGFPRRRTALRDAEGLRDRPPRRSPHGPPRASAQLLSESPLMFVFDDFLSERECEDLMALARPDLRRSRVTDGKLSEGRTSSSTFLTGSRQDHPVVKVVERRILRAAASVGRIVAARAARRTTDRFDDLFTAHAAARRGGPPTSASAARGAGAGATPGAHPRRSSAPSPCRWCATTAARCTRRTTTTSRGACVARRRS